MRSTTLIQACLGQEAKGPDGARLPPAGAPLTSWWAHMAQHFTVQLSAAPRLLCLTATQAQSQLLVALQHTHAAIVPATGTESLCCNPPLQRLCQGQRSLALLPKQLHHGHQPCGPWLLKGPPPAGQANPPPSCSCCAEHVPHHCTGNGQEHSLPATDAGTRGQWGHRMPGKHTCCRHCGARFPPKP